MTKHTLAYQNITHNRADTDRYNERRAVSERVASDVNRLEHPPAVVWLAFSRDRAAAFGVAVETNKTKRSLPPCTRPLQSSQMPHQRCSHCIKHSHALRPCMFVSVNVKPAVTTWIGTSLWSLRVCVRACVLRLSQCSVPVIYKFLNTLHISPRAQLL